MIHLREAPGRLRQRFSSEPRPASDLRGLVRRRHRRRVRLWIGACAVGLMLVGLAVAAASIGKGNDTQEVVAAEPFVLPLGEQALLDRSLVYVTRELDWEETDPAGNVLKPAVLVDRRYRFTVSRNGDWTQEQIGGPRPWERSEFIGGVHRIWEDGLLTVEQRLAVPNFPHRALVPVAVQQLGAVATDGHFDVTSTQQLGVYTLQRYERQIPKPNPDSEYLQSLPWKEAGNAEVVELKFNSQSGDIALWREYLNGFLKSSFEVEQASS